MRRCPNGTRRKNGECIQRSIQRTKKSRCKRGYRRKNGECIQRVDKRVETPFIQQYETKFDRF